MSKFQCFIDTSDITDCFMIVLPSPSALEHEDQEYYDDYYVQTLLSSVEGKLYIYLHNLNLVILLWIRKDMLLLKHKKPKNHLLHLFILK